MSWYRDPQLFILRSLGSRFYVCRITKEFGNPIQSSSDYGGTETFDFSKHLYLGNNKESDYDAFKASFFQSGELYKFLNSKGEVVNYDGTKYTGTWSHEEPNSLFWSLPGIAKPKSVTEESLEGKVIELEEKNSSLQQELNTKKVEKESQDKRVSDLEKQVSVLTSKLEHCCGARGGSSIEEPWMSEQTVPSNWVSFRELDVLAFSKKTPLAITKAIGGSKIGDDNTTNVKANRFYGGIFPVVVVDVAELTPNREEARFDPCVWGLYDNAGISYAARKPFASEMSVDGHKTC